MSRPFKLGLIQVPVTLPDDGYKARTEWMLAEAEKTFADGAELIFLPEAYQYALDRSVLSRPAELKALTAEYKEKCSAIARKYHSYFVVWDYEVDEEGGKYNTAYVLDREGKEIGRHRKVHLTYGEQNKYKLTNGDGYKVFDLDICKLGIMICWDNYFPESSRILGLKGAELILYPLYGDTLDPGWEIKLRARALDNALYVAPSCLSTERHVFTGLVSPYGDIAAKVENVGSHVLVNVDPAAEVRTFTSGVPEDIRKLTGRCRRPQAYSPITEQRPLTPWEEIYDAEFPK